MAPTGEVFRELGISEQSYYRWRKEYGGMQVSQARKLKDLERENARLKKLVAEQASARRHGCGRHLLQHPDTARFQRPANGLTWRRFRDSEARVRSHQQRILGKAEMPRSEGSLPVNSNPKSLSAKASSFASL